MTYIWAPLSTVHTHMTQVCSAPSTCRHQQGHVYRLRERPQRLDVVEPATRLCVIGPRANVANFDATSSSSWKGPTLHVKYKYTRRRSHDTTSGCTLARYALIKGQGHLTTS